MFQHTAARRRLLRAWRQSGGNSRFNTQPPEGGWYRVGLQCFESIVSTHSRPKAADEELQKRQILILVSTHSRPKAAERKKAAPFLTDKVSTHSRPKAAGLVLCLFLPPNRFNTQPPEGGWALSKQVLLAYRPNRFNTQPPEGGCPVFERLFSDYKVSTHSRPKAAGGGLKFWMQFTEFQHTAARRRLIAFYIGSWPNISFNTQPPEGG